MTSTELDLGPRTLAPSPDRPFVLSTDEIAAISNYASDVRAVWASVVDFRIPAEMRGMVAASERWESETVPLMRDMADSLYRYGTVTAPRSYGALLERLDALPSGVLTDDVRSDLAPILDALIDTCGSHVAEARTVLESVSEFATNMEVAEAYVRAQIAERADGKVDDWQDLTWKAVEKNRGNPKVAVAAAQEVWGVWQALYTDLIQVRNGTAEVLGANLRFLTRARIELALRQWKDLGNGAWDFKMSL